MPILSVSATDADSGDAGTVEYQLQGSSAVFSVGSSDGGIRLEASPASGKFNLISSASQSRAHYKEPLSVLTPCVNPLPSTSIFRTVFPRKGMTYDH